MHIGVARIILDFYNNDNLALKHRRIEELCKDIRKKFNVSILETGDFDDPERCVIGLAVTMPETWKESRARSLLQKICSEIDQTSFARVMIEDCDLLSHGD